ncbi:DUF4340 domain-containing protein [Algiphilus sp. NNCM1]|nr:DUF4340 domain-containing protein [Algiphilus acroporae]MCI5061347.1 DUF4340 domain-containing protein [Algiphilus sp.]
MRRHIVNLVLLFLIGAVAALVWMRKEAPEPPPEPLLAESTESIQRVGFRIPGGETVMAARKNDGWRLTEPVSAPADNGVINSLLAAARAPVTDRIPAGEVDLSQMGFDQPERYMRFDDVEIAFGAINPVTKKRYVLMGDKVLQIRDPAGASSYHSHIKLVHKDVVPPGRKLVRVERPDWTLERDDDGWRAQRNGAAAEPVSTERAAAAGEAWTVARAMWTGEPNRDPETESESVVLHFAEGDSVELRAIRGQQLLLQRADFAVQYHVARNLTGLLLDLDAPPEDPAEGGQSEPPGEGIMAPAGH